ncbi:AN1-type zinc finger protein 5-like [Grus japonensis]|uniref:AN1-type zinc finger protein 5-like n=1 Tax=Grus japonensis TaxID=30415 RepID=A0ABC9VZ42_GRUJA
MEKTMVRQAVPLQPMEVDDGADIHLQPMEDPTPEQVEAPEGACDPMGSSRWSKLLAGPVAPWREEPTPGQAPFGYWKAAIRSPWSLLFSRLNNPNSLSLSS